MARTDHEHSLADIPDQGIAVGELQATRVTEKIQAEGRSVIGMSASGHGVSTWPMQDFGRMLGALAGLAQERIACHAGHRHGRWALDLTHVNT